MRPMSKYQPGEHVKIEVTHPASGESEWMWLYVESCDDEAKLVFGKLDDQPIINADMRLGQELAVSFDNIRDRRKF